MSLPEKIQLEIVTPERMFFRGEVDEVSVPAVQGSLGILPGHAPLLSELEIGTLSYRRGSEELSLFCSWGFVEVLPDRVSVLAEVAEAPDQIDVAGAQEALRQAEELLRSGDEDVDYQSEMDNLRQAQVRLKVAGKGS